MPVITEEQANERLNDSRNLLNRIRSGSPETKIIQENDSIVGSNEAVPQIQEDASPSEYSETQIPTLIIDDLYKGGRGHAEAIPEQVQVLAGTLAHFDTAADVGALLDISKQHTHHLKHGRTGHNKEKKSLKSQIAENLGSVHNEALIKAALALGLITEESIQGMKPKDLAYIAEKMAQVAAKTGISEKRAAPMILIQMPRIKNDGEFGDVIEISASPA